MSNAEQFQFINYDIMAEIVEMPGYDPAYVLCYYGKWATFEESGWLAIFERGGSFFQCDGGYSVMAEYHQDERLLYEPISLEEAIELIQEMERCIADVAPDTSSNMVRSGLR